MQVFDAQNSQNIIKIAIVVARFNTEVTLKLLDGALERARERQIPSDFITVVHVPGCVEIPLTVQKLAQTDEFDAVIALGAVIRGETDHYNYVCNQVSDGCQRVALENGLPVVFGVLTTDTEEQALDRCGGTHGHKGKDCVDVAIEMASLLPSLEIR